MNDTMIKKQVVMTRMAVALLLLLFTASIQAQVQAPKPGPEYKTYEVWVGDWTYEGEAKETPLGPGGKFSGKSTVRWILSGFFLEYRAQEQGPLGDLEIVEFDWYDAATKRYPYQGYMNNGEVYSATATVSGSVWKISGTQTHKGVQYKIRGATTFAADGKSNTWKYEMSPDGKKWVPFHEARRPKSQAPARKWNRS